MAIAVQKTSRTGPLYLHLRWLVTLVFCLTLIVPINPVRAESPTPSANRGLAKTLLASMSPEEKVGQLFMVTFSGTDTSTESQIHDLIVNRHVGGVMLSAANGNFSTSQETPAEVYALTQSLQKLAIDVNATGQPAHGIPVFLGISQEGDLYPNDQILSGLTALPDEMAIGATWKPEMARNAGAVAGDELRRLGFNFYLGPSLDVLDNSTGSRVDDLGVRSFGGDPFWVGEMGKNYIAGLHEGSKGGMVVISKHFPGRGGSDRPADDEVATVRKSLEQLKQIELAPFFSTTNVKNSPETITDGLSVSHIRYQGFQGNIRATTKPVSFDATALSQLMGLPDLQPWRESGGLLVSDNLGSPAVRKFFDPTGISFDGRQVARNALLAGNDLLYVNNFISSGDVSTYDTLIKTFDFFAQKYREDPAFAQRVNTSVERILALKYRLYSKFDAESVLSPEDGLSELGKNDQVTFDIAQNAVTLISPGESDLANVLARPPEMKERMVFFTDVITGKQCDRCVEQVTMESDALQKAVLRLYGPQAGGQVTGSRMSSYSFADLEQMLIGAVNTDTISSDVREADWIVFSFQNISPDRPISQAMKRLLSERQDLVRNKKVVAFAFNAPYYLDSTDISKFTVYYALYSKIPSFIDVAARVLFQEVPASGKLPVSVPGIGYDMIKVTIPDSKQIIPLALDLPGVQITPESAPQASIIPTQIPLFNVGDNLPLKAGIIVDQNGNPVPDGTVARFIFTLGDEKSIVQQVETTTSGGYAHTVFRIPNSGLLEIRVISEPALTSQILRLDVSGNGGAQVTAIAPTPEPTRTEEPEPTHLPTPTTAAAGLITEARVRSFGGWLAGLIVLMGMIFGFYEIASHKISVRWGVRFALMTALMGSFGLVIYGLTPIGKPLPEIWNALVFSGTGCLTGGACAWIWYTYPRWLSGKPD
jgi:beta-N-acetylhexosaminidase